MKIDKLVSLSVEKIDSLLSKLSVNDIKLIGVCTIVIVSFIIIFKLW